MASEHYCKEHDAIWFMKGKMKNYAHPIEDDEGNATGKWCNEPEGTEPKPKKETKDTESPGRQTSIEAQNAYTGIIALMCSGKIDIHSPLAETATNYAMSKLGNWSSMGAVEESQPSNEPMITGSQSSKILELAKEKSYDNQLVVAMLLRLYEVSARKDLTKKQASDFIEKLAEGYGLGENPKDLPF